MPFDGYWLAQKAAIEFGWFHDVDSEEGTRCGPFDCPGAEPDSARVMAEATWDRAHKRFVPSQNESARITGKR